MEAELKNDAKKVNEFYLRIKRMPSFSEMLRLFHLKSKNAVSKRIDKLIEAGLIKPARNAAHQEEDQEQDHEITR